MKIAVEGTKEREGKKVMEVVRCMPWSGLCGRTEWM